MDTAQKYNFNPYQFTGPDWWLRDFHRRHVSYFSGCKRVLDLGAGRGLFLEELRDAAIEGIGVEGYLPSCEEGRAKRLRYYHSDIFAFFSSPEGQLQSHQCDGVYCAHVIEHMQPEQLFELFRCIRRYCASGVRVRMITNNPADIDVLGHVFWGDLTHQRLYPGVLLEAMAKSQGFTSTISKPFHGLRLGKRDMLRRVWDRPFWGKHKWVPNLLLDCS
ncbi:MAG: class I SAM-dependent methyltransferase [Verrucomicrobia bacterium]|nr:class I SAM-dependent methyltransferase [Verrucomicrobiota bacterium]